MSNPYYTISYVYMKLPIKTLVNNDDLYDIEIEISHDFYNKNVHLYFNIEGLTENINGDIYNKSVGNNIDNKYFIFKDCKLIDYIFPKSLNVKFTLQCNNITYGTLKVIRFNIRPKSDITNEYLNTYEDPKYLYSYNSSIKGTLGDNDKNGIHVFLNDKFKNVLVVVNKNIPMNINWKSLNNIDIFGENHGLYYGKSKDNRYNIFPSMGKYYDYLPYDLIYNYDPSDISAFNYMESLNNINDKGKFDININYHYIDIDGNYANGQVTQFKNSTFNKLPNWDNIFPDYLLKTNKAEKLNLNIDSYIVEPFSGPRTNIKDKFVEYNQNGVPLPESIIDEPLSRRITQKNNITTTNIITVVNNGEKISNNISINRFVGNYEPIMKNIPMYKPLYFWKETDINGEHKFKSIDGNYKFNDNLDKFAKITEFMYSKVNENENVLKLSNTTEKSVYPMIDEFGLSQTERNIFSSTWDSDYFIRTINNTILSDYIDSIVEEEIINITSGQFKNIELDGYYKGINIYGHGNNSNKLKLNINVVNMSSDNKFFKYNIKYYSSYKSYYVLSGLTNSINTNDTQTLELEINRPLESKNEQFFEEFTKWNIILELYDNDILLDVNNDITLNVYNDIIDFNLINPYGSVDFYKINMSPIPYYVNKKYNFSIDIIETIDKLKNIKCVNNLKQIIIGNNSELYKELLKYYGSGDIYDKLMLLENDVAYNIITNFISNKDKLTILRSSIDEITNKKTITYNDIIIPVEDLNYNSNEKRIILFETIHNYKIKDTINYIKKGNVKVIHVNRIQQEPNLKWDSLNNITSTEIFQGICKNGKYTGDYIKTSTKIINMGGPFNGSIKIIFNLRENGITILTKSVVQEYVEHNSYGTIIENGIAKFENIILGPNLINNDPLILYKNKLYDIRISTLYINENKVSNKFYGLNETYPNCSII